MSPLGRRLIFGFLISVFISATGPFCPPSVALAWNVSTVQAGNFAPGRLEEHYLKHGYQFGNITIEQYLQGAQALLDAAPGKDVLEKIRANGDIEHYRASTGEFAVMTRWGRIRTYYKTNYWYWIRH